MSSLQARKGFRNKLRTSMGYMIDPDRANQLKQYIFGQSEARPVESPEFSMYHRPDGLPSCKVVNRILNSQYQVADENGLVEGFVGGCMCKNCRWAMRKVHFYEDAFIFGVIFLVLWLLIDKNKKA